MSDFPKTQLAIRVHCAKCGRLLPLTHQFPLVPKNQTWAHYAPTKIESETTALLEFGVAPCDHCDGEIQRLYARLKDALAEMEEAVKPDGGQP